MPKREWKASISNKGAELKRRTGKTSTRDQIKETLSGIFETARDGRHFTDLLEKENLKIYQRGKQHGVIDQDGTKYRFSTLGLAEEWEALDKRMTEQHQAQTQPKKKQREAQQEKPEKQHEDTLNTGQDTEKTQTNRHAEPKPEAQEQPQEPVEKTQRTQKTPLQNTQNTPDTYKTILYICKLE